MSAGMRTLAAADNGSAAAFLYHAASLREGYRHDIINRIEFDGGMEMLIFDGKDSTIYVVAAVSMILLFSLQYFICTRTERSIIRAIPFVYPFLLLALAMICYASPDGGWIDLRLIAALLLLGYAAICMVSILLARFLYRCVSGHSKNG